MGRLVFRRVFACFPRFLVCCDCDIRFRVVDRRNGRQQLLSRVCMYTFVDDIPEEVSAFCRTLVVAA